MAKMKLNGNAADLLGILPSRSEARQYWHAWNNPESFAAYVAASTPGWHASTWRVGADRTEWSGAESVAAACQMARDGWSDGAARAARLRDKINAATPLAPRLAIWAVAGAYPSIARALSGNPACMRAIDSTRARRKPVLTLVSDMCVGWHVSAAALLNRAAVVAAIVDAIEAAGFACHVVTVAQTHKSDLAAGVAVTVKESNDAADIARLAFGLGHAALFRRMCFAAWTETAFTKGLGDNLGGAVAPRITADHNRDGVYLVPNATDERFETEDAAATRGLEWIVNVLQQQACPAFQEEQFRAA